MRLPSWTALAEQALAGELIARDDALAVLRAPDDRAARPARRRLPRAPPPLGQPRAAALPAQRAERLCPEDCGYCSQSKISGAEIDKYPMLARERILEAADRAAALNAGTFCMVISGRSPAGACSRRCSTRCAR
jgi:biotin synthase